MAIVELTTSQTAGGLATNPDGSLADVPRALASDMHGELMQVIALLYSVCDAIPSSQDDHEAYADGLTSPSSRAETLTIIADEKVRSVIRALTPYV
jgi:hypothetical protein